MHVSFYVTNKNCHMKFACVNGASFIKVCDNAQLIYETCTIFSVVKAVPEVKPDLITTEINDYYGYMKDFDGFSCQATGTNLKYSWRHNDILIDENYISKYPKWNASTLRPLGHNIDRSYEGFYQCFVQNSIGTIFGRKANVKFTSKYLIYQLNEDKS